MTIQEIANEFHTYDIVAESENADMYSLYNEALDFVFQGESGEAKKLLRKVVRMDNTFDDGNMLLALVLFSMGNRIDGMKQVNAIIDDEKHDRAMRYIDMLSGASADAAEKKAPAAKKAKEPETVVMDFEDPAVEDTAAAKDTAPAKDTAAAKGSASPVKKPAMEDFSKRFKKAKEAQKAELEHAAELEHVAEGTDKAANDSVASGDTVVCNFDFDKDSNAKNKEQKSAPEKREPAAEKREPAPEKREPQAEGNLNRGNPNSNSNNSKNILKAIGLIAASVLVLTAFAAIAVITKL